MPEAELHGDRERKARHVLQVQIREHLRVHERAQRRVWEHHRHEEHRHRECERHEERVPPLGGLRDAREAAQLRRVPLVVHNSIEARVADRVDELAHADGRRVVLDARLLQRERHRRAAHARHAPQRLLHRRRARRACHAKDAQDGRIVVRHRLRVEAGVLDRRGNLRGRPHRHIVHDRRLLGKERDCRLVDAVLPERILDARDARATRHPADAHTHARSRLVDRKHLGIEARVDHRGRHALGRPPSGVERHTRLLGKKRDAHAVDAVLRAERRLDARRACTARHAADVQAHRAHATRRPGAHAIDKQQLLEWREY